MDTTKARMKEIRDSVMLCGVSETARKLYPLLPIKKARYKVHKVCLKVLPTCDFKGEGKGWKDRPWRRGL